MAKKVFVSPSVEGWRVKVVGNARASYVCDTKQEAVEKGIDVAKDYKAELFIQKLNGTIGQKNSYGSDPETILG